MKKIFAILAVAAVMTACNSSTEESTTTKTDSSATSNPAADAMKTQMQADSTNKMDTTHKMTDTTNKMK